MQEDLFSEEAKFVVYRSSAGSGKTFTLVKEYLKLVLSTPDPGYYKNILAITFTNKATGEMKSRVLDALSEFSYGEELRGTFKHLMDALVTETSMNEEVIRERSSKVLESLLHNYADFSISTIDGFTNRVVRTFAHDLRLPLNFDIELREELLLYKAVDMVIARAGEDKQITRILIDFARNKIEDDKSWNIENDLYRFSKLLLKEDAAFYLNQVRSFSPEDFFTFFKTIDRAVEEFEEEISALGEKAIRLIDREGIDRSLLAGGAKSGIGKYFTYLKQCRSDKFIPSKTVAKYIEQGKWAAGKANVREKANIESIAPQLKKLYEEAQQMIEEEYSRHTLLRLLQKNIYSLALLNEIDKLLEELKRENNVLHISDLNKRITDVVKNEPVPFVYERIGERYRNYLIDEFQDTSVIQWHNLLPLIDNSLSYSHMNMVVGDPKQAIYRWRGGEAEQLVNLPYLNNEKNNELLKERQVSLERNYRQVELKNNFRSLRNIIQFNNRFFSFISGFLQEPFKNIYKTVQQDFLQEKEGGYVSIEFLEHENADTFAALNCQRVEALLSDVMSRGASFKDVAILTRDNKDAELLARYLLEKDIPVVSAQSLLVESSSKVRLVVSLMKLINNKDDTIAMVSVLRDISDTGEEMHAICRELFNREQRERDDYFHEVLRSKGIAFYPRRLELGSVYEVSEHLTRALGYTSEADPYLQFFLDAVLEFSEKEGDSIVEFIHWWEENKNKLSIVVAEGVDAVSIMTIHKSKGLEFPVVIFPFVNEKVSDRDKFLWLKLKGEAGELPVGLVDVTPKLKETDYADIYSEERQRSFLDMLNLLYVSHTRAEQELYVLTTRPPGNMSKEHLSTLYMEFVSGNEDVEEDEGKYSFGEKGKISSDRGGGENGYQLKEWISDDWKGKIALSRQSADFWSKSGLTESRTLGKIIHKALSEIDSLDEVEGKLSALKNKGLISKEQHDELANKILGLLSKAELRRWFGSDVKARNEAEIILPGGKTYRPDRVVTDAGEMVVIDYKTGEPRDKDVEQVREYMSVLQDMGYQQISGYLVYLMSNNIRRVL